ncbi:hypothetical protein SUGI_0203320 [Cryptomeria japonica]|nr:hypothetical protein SUGI_0203320 [Cryptomeria japonica]
MCSFHLTTDHDGSSCPDMIRHVQMKSTKDKLGEFTEVDKIQEVPGNSGSFYFEYESDSERGGNILVTLEDPACAILTRNQPTSQLAPFANSSGANFKGKDPTSNGFSFHAKTPEVKILQRNFESKNNSSPFPSFDIIEFCKASTVQLSTAKYLKLNPKELDKLVKYVKGDSTSESSMHKCVIDSDLFISKIPTSASCPCTDLITPCAFHNAEDKLGIEVLKPKPFYISLLLNGQKLSNCIIDLGVSDNIMPSSVSRSLGLTLTKTFGRCYLMDGKQVPLIGQVKDVQVVLAACPDKRVRLTILIADIPASYGMLLSRTFYKELGGEIKMDWLEAIIPLGKQKIKLEPEPKNKYTVFPSDNPKAQILFQECEF